MDKKVLIGVLAAAVIILLCCITTGVLLWAADRYEWFDDTGPETPVETDTDSSEEPEEHGEVATPETEVEEEPEVEALAVITGMVSFPSEFIPPGLYVCAEDAYGGPDEYCTNEIPQDSNPPYQFSYELSVPAGSYYVYAYDSEGDPTYTAYYTQFVTCGLSVDCPSHEKIMVTVAAGETATGIDPGDWYDF